MASPVRKQKGSAALAAAAAILVSLMAAVAFAQSPPQSCAANLVPCQPYLASDKPPESCCGPLKQTVKDQLPCLCALFGSKDILKQLGVNLTQALDLPLHCGISNNLAACSASSLNATSKAPASPSGNNSNVAHSGGPIVILGLTCLLMLLWSMA